MTGDFAFTPWGHMPHPAVTMESGEYKTITATSTEELDKKVSEAIRQGFRPYGSPYVVKKASGTLPAQNRLICQAVLASVVP